MLFLFIFMTVQSAWASTFFKRWTNQLGEDIWGFESNCPKTPGHNQLEEWKWVLESSLIYQKSLISNDADLFRIKKMITSNTSSEEIIRIEENMILLGELEKELHDNNKRLQFTPNCPIFSKACRDKISDHIKSINHNKKMLLSIKSELLHQSPLLAHVQFDHLINFVIKGQYPYSRGEKRFFESLHKAITQTHDIVSERYEFTRKILNSSQMPKKEVLQETKYLEELLIATDGKETSELKKLFNSACRIENRILKDKAMSELRGLFFDTAVTIASFGAGSYFSLAKNTTALTLAAKSAPLFAIEGLNLGYNIKTIQETNEHCSVLAATGKAEAHQDCRKTASDQFIMAALSITTSGLFTGHSIISARAERGLSRIETSLLKERFSQAEKNLLKKGFPELVSELNRLNSNLTTSQIKNIHKAHLVGMGKSGAYTRDEILLKIRILKEGGFTKLQREAIIRGAVAGDSLRLVDLTDDFIRVTDESERIILRRGEALNHVDAHGAITSDLFNGKIVSIKRFSENDNRNSIFKVEIKGRDPFTGEIRVREAIFKPRFWGDADGWARTPMEYVAYELNLKLGMDIVPPTAYRKGLNFNMNGIQITEGAFLYKVPEFTPMSKFSTFSYGLSEAAIISDNRVLSVLMQNVDAHANNLGMGRHWVDGKMRPVFIDWSASLRKEANVFMDQYEAFGNSDIVNKIRPSTYESLQKLGPSDFLSMVEAKFITNEEVLAILGRRDKILEYFDELKPHTDIFLKD